MNNRVQMEKLFVQAILEDTEEFIADRPAVPAFSKKHQKQMNRILRSAEHWYWPLISTAKRRAVVALIAAAAVLLAGCTAYIKRDEIVRFVKEVYDKYSTLSVEKLGDETLPNSIETEYTLTYLPEGYELVDYETNSVWQCQKWQDQNGKSIILEQNIFDSSLHIVDESRGISQDLFIGEYQVFSWINDFREKHMCIWTDGVYIYILQCPFDISDNEVEAMILSISPK